MADQIRVGTGVKLRIFEEKLDYATGFISRVESDGSIGVWWMWDSSSDRYPALIREGEQRWADPIWSAEELTVVSQPDHNYWPSFWADWNLWALPQYNVDLEDGEGFVARMQHYGTPTNPWID